MSRSFKKFPIIKDNGQSHKKAKKAANQRTRTAIRNVMNNLDPLEDKIFPTARGLELTNQYDICDWKWSPLYNTSWNDYLTQKFEIKKFSRK